MNSEVIAGGTLGTFLSAVGVGLSVPGITQILSLIATIIGLIITLVSGVIIPMWKWYRKAKADGKIDPEEVEEAVDIVKKGLDDVKNDVDKLK